MSKLVRFKSILGVVALVLTLSMSWTQASAQNLSSEKKMLTFALNGQTGSTIDQANFTIAVKVPYGTDVTALKATFTSSPFSNVFVGANPDVGTLAVSGVSPAVDYTSPVVWTVEAENHSYDNYTVTVSFNAALTCNSLLAFTPDYNKDVQGACMTPDPVLLTGTNVVFNGTNVTFNVEYAADLSSVTAYYTVCDGATVTLHPSYGTIVSPGKAFLNFTADGFVVFQVTSQSGVTANYKVTPTVGDPSVQDALLGFVVPGANSVTINHGNQTIAVEVPYSTVVTNLKPTWSISKYAIMLNGDPAGSGVEICSGVATVSGMVSSYWIMAEDNSEVSEYVVTFTKAAASSAKDILALDVEYTKTWGTCTTSTETEVVTANISGTTITINVPFGVSSVTIDDIDISPLASYVTSATPPLVDGTTITVTAENGTTKVYTVDLVVGAASNGKTLTSFGFDMGTNNTAFSFGWTKDYMGVIDQAKKTVVVYVKYNTDLHDMIAMFESSTYSSVYIAESSSTTGDPSTYTPQCSDVTVNDHSNSLTYVVVAENGTEERYEVTVLKEAALSGKELIGFKLVDMSYCLDAMGTYTVSGVYTGMNIAVSVKYGTDLTALTPSFTVSEGATVVASGTNFTNPVTYTVTAQNGDVAVYTVTVTTRAQNSAKQLKTYWFDAADNAGFVSNAVGTINEAAKTVQVWVPWNNRGSISNLVARFTLSDGAVMTHSEDTPFIQKSGTSGNNFTTPVAYTVFAEDCSSVEYFVTVFITPNNQTDISAFTFAFSDCGCDLVNKIDNYAKRIYITLPSTVDISNLAPASVVIDPDASLNPLASVKQNWTKGPVIYSVVGPKDPQTGAQKVTEWEVIVENPPCQETDITSWVFGGNVQASSAVIDKTNHTVKVLLKKGTNLKNMSASIGLSCGATICCNMGACSGSYIDFSDDMCHTCVVTAQDESITQDWTICVEYEDVTDPEVITWSVMAYNCSDSVAVQSNELGYVFIVHEDAVNPDACNCDFNLADFSTNGSVASLVSKRMGAYAVVDSINKPVYVKTNGLYSGAYYAFAVDKSGNVSCVSKQKLFLDICDVDVASLCDLRGMPPVWKYTLTQEVVVSYEETRSGGNLKYVQTADCGIKIIDSNGGLKTTYGVGKGITNLKGTVYNDGCEMVFVPVCCYSPTESSSGNVITPIELTYDEFAAQCYTGSNAYEAMLVKITTPMIAFDDYSTAHTTWMFDGMDIATTSAKGDYDWFIQNMLNGNHVGEAIPTVPTIYQGIRTDVNWGACYGLISPRGKGDIMKVTAGSLIADPNPAEIKGILPTQCGSTYIDIINEGIGDLVISALYLDDLSATDEFEIIAPAQVPFTLGTWDIKTVRVDFCPLNSGNESTTLVVEYATGKVLEVPINGTTAQINDMDWCDNFNTWTQGEWIGNGWTGSVPANLSVYPSATQGWGGTPDASVALFLRNRNVVGGKRTPIQVTTPGVVVTGNDPVITWMEMAYASFNGAGTNSSPRNLYISTDGVTWKMVDSYLTSSMPDPSRTPGAWFRTQAYSLADYVGKTIWWRFELISNNNEYIYWILDNVCVQERITTPIFNIGPDPMEFGGVQVNESATQTASITNRGVSVLKVHKVELIGSDDFTLVDNNTYPVEVHDGTYAFAKNGTESLNVNVTFNPSDIGSQTAKLRVTYGLYSQMTSEITITGEGLSCFTASEAVLGENFSYQNAWWTYTAEKFQMAYVTSCDPRNTTDPYVYSYDTWLYIYSDCDGTEIANNDDLEWDACPSNRASSGLLVPMMEGETIKIFWPWAFTSAHDADGFYFHVMATYPIDGDVCETAIALTLPVVNHFGTTVGFEDDYDLSPCSPFSNYMDGNDKVYSITLETEGYLTGNILGAYGSIHVLDKCPVEELQKNNCKAFVGGPMGGQFTKRIAAGSYYVIISTWAPPQTVDFLLNMSFEEGSGVDNNGLTSNLSVYPNPTNGKFTVSISNAEATDLTVELVNISGQVVYTNNVKAVYSYNEDIDASSFAKGVYYLKVNNGTEVKVEKVVVQ